MHVSTPDTQPKLAAGMSADADTIDAAKRACAQCAEGLESPADLACVFFSPHHLTSISDLAATVQRTLGPRTLVGVSAEGVIAGDIELERAPGVSILAFHLPGVEVRPYATEQFPVLDETPESLFMLRDVVGAGEDLRCIMMFIEPFSTPFSRVLTHLNRATAGGRARSSAGWPRPRHGGATPSFSTTASSRPAAWVFRCVARCVWTAWCRRGAAPSARRWW